MSIQNNLIGLPAGDEVSGALARLCLKVEEFGVNVEEDYSDIDHARFIGIFKDSTVTIYPNVAPLFALWFTVAHLFGHITQLANETERVQKANELVLRTKQNLSAEEIQLIYDHEREAAEIGRALIASVEPKLSTEMELAYIRFFHADFRYLINFIETGEQGVMMFERYWRRETTPRELIAPDSRRLLKITETFDSGDDIIVV